MKPNRKIYILLSLFIALFLVVGFTQLALAQSGQTLEEKVARLKKTVDELKERVPRIGYINRQDAFSVFPRAVEEERRKVNELEKQMEDLSARVQEGKIDESEFKRERDLLRAKHLQARINVDLAILDTMIQARGFSEITDQLKNLKSQTRPITEKINSLIQGIEDYAVSPKQVSDTLNKIANNQFNRLDSILAEIAQNEITQVAGELANEKGYDLVIERQNVITYRKKSVAIDNLTGKVKEKLRTALQSK